MLFDYRGRTKQKYPRGGHCVEFNSYSSRLCWTCPSKDGNVMSYTTIEFELANKEEIEIFNEAIKNKRLIYSKNDIVKKVQEQLL